MTHLNDHVAAGDIAPATITIWHNPKCGTSRNALAMIRATGAEPRVVEYLNTPPDATTLARVAKAVGGARALMRVKGTPAEELGLLDADEATIFRAMATHPMLINRPVVIGPRGIVLARPSEKALDVLDGALPDDFTKEDGEKVTRGA